MVKNCTTIITAKKRGSTPTSRRDRKCRGDNRIHQRRSSCARRHAPRLESRSRRRLPCQAQPRSFRKGKGKPTACSAKSLVPGAQFSYFTGWNRSNTHGALDRKYSIRQNSPAHFPRSKPVTGPRPVGSASPHAAQIASPPPPLYLFLDRKRRTNSEYDKLPSWPLKPAPLLSRTSTRSRTRST
jgi:hypothetical protein